MNMIDLLYSNILYNFMAVCLRDSLELYTAKHDAQLVENEIIKSAIRSVAEQLVLDWVMFNYIRIKIL